MKDDEVYPLPYGFDIEKYPNTAKYIMLHGANQVMSVWNGTAPYDSREAVYEECLKRGVTWKELLHFEGYDDKILL